MLGLYLLRHGETACSAADRSCGRCEVPLNARGLEQAKALARAWGDVPWQGLYTSPLPRALQTAEVLAHRFGLEPRVDAGLAELDYGSWDGLAPAELRANEPEAYAAWLADPAAQAPPGGETALQVAERVEGTVETLRRRHVQGVMLAVAHKSSIRILLCQLLGIPVAQYRWRFAQPLGAMNLMEWRTEGPMLALLADTSHLGRGPGP